jgi:hypothetical protein
MRLLHTIQLLLLLLPFPFHSPSWYNIAILSPGYILIKGFPDLPGEYKKPFAIRPNGFANNADEPFCRSLL